MVRLLNHRTNRGGGICGLAKIDDAEVVLMVTASAWHSEWSAWGQEEALRAICRSLVEQCDAATLEVMDSVTVSSRGAHGLDQRGRHLFTDLPVKPAH